MCTLLFFVMYGHLCLCLCLLFYLQLLYTAASLPYGVKLGTKIPFGLLRDTFVKMIYIEVFRMIHHQQSAKNNEHILRAASKKPCPQQELNHWHLFFEQHSKNNVPTEIEPLATLHNMIMLQPVLHVLFPSIQISINITTYY